MSLHVLVVEDVVLNQTILAAMLDEAGYEVSTVEDATGALRILRGQEIDLVLLDVMLPGAMDGFALCRWIKTQPQYVDLPVIFITALDNTESKVRGLDLGAADYIPKPFKREEVLARVKTQVRLRQLTRSLTEANRELREKQKLLETDLRSAALVQQSFIPEPGASIPRFNVEWRFTPSRHIGGDIFNVAPIGEGWWGVYLVDVSGHGVPPALVTIAVAQTILQELHSSFVLSGETSPSPSAIIRTLERQFPMERFDRYFTIVLMMIDTSGGHLVYSNAGHPPPILLRDSKVELLEAGGPPVGMALRPENDEGSVALRRGDRLFLYTDGLIEQVDQDRIEFGLEKLADLVEGTREQTLSETCDLLVGTLDGYRGELDLDDDLALLALEYLG